MKKLNEMTPQKALWFFKEELKAGKCSDDCLQCNSMEMAISALEKQIPKKPTYEKTNNIYGAMKRICANCGDVCFIGEAAKPYEHYCRYCGIKFDDWSDIE